MKSYAVRLAVVVSIGAFGAFGAFGCAGTGEGESADSGDVKLQGEPESVATAVEALNNYSLPGQTWTQAEGTKFIYMPGTSTPVGNSFFCYLTQMQGHFQGSGESIWVGLNASNQWQIGGSSAQSGVGANARCIPLSGGSLSTKQTWYQGNAQKYLASTALANGRGNLCALTRIQGHFEGGGEHVDIIESGGSYYLTGGSGQAGVGAQAQCALNIPFTLRGSADVVGAGGSACYYQWRHYAADLLNWRNSACVMTAVSGKFKGGGERATIGLMTVPAGCLPPPYSNICWPTDDYWFSEADSCQTAVMLKTTCVR